jgi:hypothetical protein
MFITYFYVQSNLSKPLKMEDVDSSSGLLIPFYDHDTSMIYLAGKVCAMRMFMLWYCCESNLIAEIAQLLLGACLRTTHSYLELTEDFGT